MDEVLKYLRGNYEYLRKIFQEKLPKAIVAVTESTYLVWIDFRAYFPPEKNEDLESAIVEAGVILESGSVFGKLGNGFMRMNIACPRPVFEEALNRIIGALTKA